MTLYYKMQQILLQNPTAILLQNVTEFYYKMRQLLQIATILLQNATVITKMRRLLQIATINTHLGFNAIKMLKKISLAFLTQVET